MCAKRSSGIYFGLPTILIFPSKALDVTGQILATAPRPFTIYEHCEIIVLHQRVFRNILSSTNENSNSSSSLPSEYGDSGEQAELFLDSLEKRFCLGHCGHLVLYAGQDRVELSATWDVTHRS